MEGPTKKSTGWEKLDEKRKRDRRGEGRPTTRRGRAQHFKVKPETAQRMAEVEQAYRQGLSRSRMARLFMAKWGVKEYVVWDAIYRVENLWAEIAEDVPLAHRRSIARERLEDLLRIAVTRTRSVKKERILRDANGDPMLDDVGKPIIEKYTEDVPFPDHYAISRYTEQLNRIDGLYQDKLELDHKGAGLADLMKMAIGRKRAAEANGANGANGSGNGAHVAGGNGVLKPL